MLLSGNKGRENGREFPELSLLYSSKHRVPLSSCNITGLCIAIICLPLQGRLLQLPVSSLHNNASYLVLPLSMCPGDLDAAIGHYVNIVMLSGDPQGALMALQQIVPHELYTVIVRACRSLMQNRKAATQEEDID